MTAPTVDELTKFLEDIQAEMLPDQKSMDKLTLHYIANRTWASELNKCYQELEDGLKDMDVLKASGLKLDAIVAHVLIGGRLPGDYAAGILNFSTSYPATSDITIPAGTKCYAILPDGTKVYYVTTQAGTVLTGESLAAIAARSVNRGIEGNIGPYKILQMVSRVTGITAVENQLEFDGGTAAETDDALKERYFDAIQAPGRATVSMLERALNDLTTIQEVRVINYGSGDMGILVDYSGGIEGVSDEIVAAIETNKAAGTQARGCLGAIIDADQVVILNDDVYGGQIWVRPRNYVAIEDSFSLTYSDMDGATQTADITIPVTTHRGEMILAEMASESSRAKKILTVTPSGNNSYDILMGMGVSGRLYNLPELIEVGVVAHIRLTDTPESGLVDTIVASLTAFLGAYRIGENLEYSDVQRFMFNLYDPTADECIGRPLKGIDEIVSLQVTGGGQAAVKNGDKITVEEDWRIEAGSMTVIVDS
jgi:uncharacterized phage protein gp47/JayE